jgi:hypothetical protein
MPLPPIPVTAAYGMLIYGTPRGIGFPTLKEAETAGAGLAARGDKVQIVDKVTKQIVKTFP